MISAKELLDYTDDELREKKSGIYAEIEKLLEDAQVAQNEITIIKNKLHDLEDLVMESAIRTALHEKQ